jgi:50S ribosomal subunit-associated GTPase HflX
LTSYIANNEDPNRVVCAISAKSGEGIDTLLTKVEEIIHQGKSKVTFVIPNSEQGALNILYKNATVENVEYGYEGVTVVATVDQKVRGMLKKYDVNRPQDVEEF